MVPKSVDTLVGFYLILLLFGSSLLPLFLHVVSFLAMGYCCINVIFIDSILSSVSQKERRIDSMSWHLVTRGCSEADSRAGKEFSTLTLAVTAWVSVLMQGASRQLLANPLLWYALIEGRLLFE